MEKFSPEKQVYQQDIEKAEEVITEEQKIASEERQTSFEAGEKHGKREMIKDLLNNKSKRILLEGMAKLSDQLGQPEQVEKPKELEKEISLEKAQEIMSKDFLGPEAVKNVFGVELEIIPPIQFTKEDIERAKELDQQLVLYVDKTKDGKPFTGKELFYLTENETSDEDEKDLFYKNEELFIKETPRAGWKLVSKETIPDSTSKNYLEQTEIIINYLKNEVFKGRELPEEYQEAISEFESQKSDIAKIIGFDSDWKSAADKLENLQITNLTRELPVEFFYRKALNEKINKERVTENFNWTMGRYSNGNFVTVGAFSLVRYFVSSHMPNYRENNIGVSFSRSL